jgi:hypothetical protein
MRCLLKPSNVSQGPLLTIFGRPICPRQCQIGLRLSVLTALQTVVCLDSILDSLFRCSLLTIMQGNEGVPEYQLCAAKWGSQEELEIGEIKYL